jgi:hypothetical protein
MFPIPSGRKLSFVEIANYWSREISPPASPQELRDIIGKAWWRGELIAANGSNRLSVLRGYYLRSAGFVAFVVPGVEEPPQWQSVDDGVVEFVRPLRVPLPNADSATWTDANCAEAFEAIAEQWKEAIISPSAPQFLDVVLTQSEFLRWIDTYRYTRPTFWGKAIPQPTDKTVRRERSKPVKFQIQRAVEALAKERRGKFPSEDMPVFERDRLIMEWIAGDDDPVKKPSKRTLREYFNKQRS